MAEKHFTHEVSVAHTSGLLTAVRYLIAANNRVILHGIDIFPQGATPASTPLQFYFGKMSTAGTGVADSAALIKVPPTYSASLLTTAFITFSSEPTQSTPAYPISVHMQGSIFQWKPRTPIVMEAAENWGLWYPASQTAQTVGYLFYLEE